MSTLRKAFCLLLTVPMLFVSCKKDEEPKDNTPTPTRTELLSGNDWVINSYMVDPAEECDGQMVTEIFPDCFDTCDLDDIMDLNSDGTYELRQSTIMCSGDPDDLKESGVWVLNSDETMITFSDGTDPYFYEIISVSANALILEETYVEGGITHTNTIHYD